MPSSGKTCTAWSPSASATKGVQPTSPSLKSHSWVSVSVGDGPPEEPVRVTGRPSPGSAGSGSMSNAVGGTFATSTAVAAVFVVPAPVRAVTSTA